MIETQGDKRAYDERAEPVIYSASLAFYSFFFKSIGNVGKVSNARFDSI